MSKNKTPAYDVHAIEAHEGLAGVRAVPGMYLGENDSRGRVHCFKEVFGNSADEATNGHGKIIRVFFAKDGTVTIGDEGRGIPVGPWPKDKKRDTLTILFTVLHSGGKFAKGKENYSRGRIGCFVGSTKIKLLKGKSVRIDKLARQFEATGKKRWVYSFNKESGLSFFPRKAYGIFATRMADRLTEVVLSNGKTVRCTPDHPFMLWDGEYVNASKLKSGASLRAVHFAEDKDGYLTHSGPKRLPTKPVQSHMHRVQRTVAIAMGWNIDGKDVAHKNANKKDNRPNNLEPMERKEHWEHDNKQHGRGKNWIDKGKAERKISSANMTRLNEQVEDLQTQAQLGRYAQIVARAYRDYGVVTEGTYNASVPWCGPKWDKAVIALGGERNVLRAGKAYYRQYGDSGKQHNGGLGLDYKLQLEYERSPAHNVNNHSVVSVRTYKLRKPIQVYGMSVEVDHNYLLDAGVFVKNTHGVGLGVVNAVSERLEVWSYRNKVWNHQAFKRGEPQTPKPQPIKALPSNLGFTDQPKAGTVVRFKTDDTCFTKGSKFDTKLAIEWLEEVSWLIGDVKIRYQVEGHKEHTFHRPNGLLDRFDYELKRLGAEALHEPLVYHNDQIDLLMGWTDQSEETIYSAVGAVRTSEGGTHVNGLIAAINRCFDDHKKKEQYNNTYLRAGLIAVINIKMDKPKFNSQDKVKLFSEEAREIVLQNVYDGDGPLWNYLKKNRALLQAILDRAVEFTGLNENFKASKRLAAQYKPEQRGGKIKMPPSWKGSETEKPEERELYVVEGGSAAGSAGPARDSYFQEVYPLSGKIPNIYKSNVEQVLEKNFRIVELLMCIGYNPANPGKYRVGKVILLTDADDDGQHIGALLLALFQRVAVDLIAQGRIFIADAPLFRYQVGKNNIYGANLSELKRNVKAANHKGAFNNDAVTRIKGWGEVPAKVLEEVAFSHQTRKLTRVTPALIKKQQQKIIDLMGENVEARRILIGIT